MATIELSRNEIAALMEALDSHLYWQCSDEEFRHDGCVVDRSDPESDTISRDPARQAEGLRVRRLFEKLERLTHRPPPKRTRNSPRRGRK